MTTDLDPGLQAERTAMAWQRTALGIGGVSALLLHHAQGHTLLLLPGALGLVGALALLLVVETRYVHTHRHVEEGNNPMGPRLVRQVAVGVMSLAVVAVIVVPATYVAQ